MTLDDAVQRLESLFKVHPTVGDIAFSPTREPYIVVQSGGVVRDGERARLYASNPEDAVQTWLDGALAYAAGKSGGTLYWRVRPELDEAVLMPSDARLGDALLLARRYYKVYSRFLISSAPIVAQEAA